MAFQIHHNYYMDNEIFKRKIIVFIIFLLLISVAIIITVVYLKNSNVQNIDKNMEESGENFTESYGKIESGGVDEQAYVDIKACMKKYLNAININSTQYGSYDENGNYIRLSQESEIKQKIYNLLGEKYITENNVTVENIDEKIKSLKESAVFVPIELSMIQDGNIKSFLVYGLIQSVENYEVLDKLFAVINIDFYENKFSIEPIYEKYNNISEIKIEKFEDTITPNDDNSFYSEYISAKDVPEEYINLYKRLALGYPEKMYELLNEEYRNAKFGNVDNFKQYVQQNAEKIKLISLKTFQVNTDNNKVQYVCVDKNENYYIFNQNEIFQDYDVILDTYTIDLPEFVNKYNSASNQVKSKMNMEKIISAIKDGDFKYVYSKLDSTFKTNNFANRNSLENYFKNNQIDLTNIENFELSQDGNLYIYKTKTGNKDFYVIMQLGNGTDFTMSINVE